MKNKLLNVLKILLAAALLTAIILNYDYLSNLDIRELISSASSVFAAAAIVLGVYFLKSLVFVVPASLIYVSGDTIRWKTALTAVSPEALSALPDDDRRPLDRVLGVENQKGELYLLTAIYLTLMALTLALSLFYDKAVLHRKAQGRKDKTPNGKE